MKKMSPTFVYYSEQKFWLGYFIRASYTYIYGKNVPFGGIRI